MRRWTQRGTEELAKAVQLLLNLQVHETPTWICVAEGFRKLEEPWGL